MTAYDLRKLERPYLSKVLKLFIGNIRVSESDGINVKCVSLKATHNEYLNPRRKCYNMQYTSSWF